MTAGTTTLLIAGLYVGWVDALLTGVVTSLLASWQTGSFGRLPPGWVQFMHRIPALLRFAAVPLVSYLLASQLLERTWTLGSFRPVLIASLGTLVIYCLFFPRQQLDLSVDKGVTT